MAEPSEVNVVCPRCKRLERRVAELEAEVAKLRGAVEDATRAAKRQAAPFSRNNPKTHPKKPGRAAGHVAAHRPPPAEVSETIEVPLEACPHCGGRLEDCQTHEQVVTDLPEIKPVTRCYRTRSGYCRRCAKRVRSRHPEQTSDASGSAGQQIGPNAQALAADLKHRLGLSYRKITELYSTHFGLYASPGTLARSGQRLARYAAGTYRALTLILRAGQTINADETGWRIGGRSAWLWVFTNRVVTVYTIESNRGQTVIRNLLGGDFQGVLSSDCALAYDPIEVEKQKCLGHILNDLSELETYASRGALRFSQAASKLLRDSIALKRRRPELSPHGYASARGQIEARMDRLLKRRYRDPDAQRLANRMIKHREHLFTFLYHEAVEPTNNAAERALRPAVIIRKLSAGNRSPTGARTHSILASVAQTARQCGQSFARAAKAILCRRDPEYFAPVLPGMTP